MSARKIMAALRPIFRGERFSCDGSCKADSLPAQRWLETQFHKCSANSGVATKEKNGTFRPERSVAQAVATSINNSAGRTRLFDKASAENVASKSNARA